MTRRLVTFGQGMSSVLAMSAWLVLGPGVASAQEPRVQEDAPCTVLCRPELNLEPTLSLGDLIAAPRVENIATGERRRLPVDPAFQATLSLGIPTEVRYVGLTLETIFTPFVDGNAVEFEGELNRIFLPKDWTAGWLSTHFDIIWQLSPRARPGGSSAYTHKLDLELDVALYVFNWLPPPSWLRDVSVEASFDYLATGLPRRGDVIDGERYLDRASGWSLSLLVVLPLAPLER